MATRARTLIPRRWPTSRANNVRVLVATDIAARGLDIDQLPHVVNFELPNVEETALAALAARREAAISMVAPDEENCSRASSASLASAFPMAT